MEPKAESSPARLFEAANECIYCGSKDGELTDEHIIPEGLCGSMIIPHASCKTCQDKTSLLELHVLRNDFGLLRRQLGINTRRSRKKKKRPTAIFSAFSGENEIDLAPEDVPAPFAMTTWAEPGLLRGVDTGGQFESIVVRMANTLGHPAPAEPITVRTLGDPTSLARFIAKICHGLAYTQFTNKGYELTLGALVRGIDIASAPYLVGGSSHHVERKIHDDGRAGLHYIAFEELNIGRTTYLVVHISLFHPFGGPMYQAVAGKKERPGWAIELHAGQL